MSLLRLVALLVAYLCIAHSAPLDEVVIVPLAEPENYRLTRNVVPSAYTLSLRPYLLEKDKDRFTFDGDALITISAVEKTRQLVLHAKNLKFSVSEYWQKANPNTKENLPAGKLNTVTDKITYDLTKDLLANTEYVLHFKYTGTMDDDMHGFYRSSYIDQKNQTKWLGSTQFQTNHARRAFPSFDEPWFKATFDLSITHHKSMKAVSNGHIVKSERANDYVTDQFAITPKMSTYILAFIVSEFNERSNGDFGVIARPEYYDQTEYSYTVGQKVLKELDTYFDIPYYSMGVEKMHMAAIPDFSAGAMENWGLLTYRERALLYVEGATTLNAKQYIAAVVAHEQTHMWFGDLVTCDWWSYAWLNEGFARYFQYFGTAMVETELDLEKQFVVDQIQTVMNMDSTNSTNPMSDLNTNTPADLGRMFNSITYNKGGTFIRMVKHIMGEEKFKNSLREYLKDNKYKNTVPDDLFKVWSQAKYWPTEFAAESKAFFEGYTTQVGYPVVNVNVAKDRKSFEISQKRFLLNERDVDSKRDLLYTIPITYTSSLYKDFNATQPKLFLRANTNKQSVVVTTQSNNSWVIVNLQETGYYRVNYDTDNWHAIHHALEQKNWGDIIDLNRAQIVDDLLNLARAGEVHYNLTLSVLEYLQTETHYLPWTAAFNGYAYLAIRLGIDTNAFGKYILQLTEKSYKALGFEERSNDSALDIYNRAKVLAWACKYGSKDCISKSNSYFNQLQNASVPVNIRSAVYCTAMREGDGKDFDKLFNKYKLETVATEETLILNSLGCVKKTDLVNKYFFIIMGNDVRRQDKNAALTSLYTENNENVSPVFKLVTDNYKLVQESLGGYSAVASVISGIASRFTEEHQKRDLENFNAQHKSEFGSSAATLEAAVKTVDNNLQWSTDKLPSFRTYLSQRGNGSATTGAFTVLTLTLVALVAMLLH